MSAADEAKTYAKSHGFEITPIGKRYQAVYTLRSGVPPINRGSYSALLNEMRFVIGTLAYASPPEGEESADHMQALRDRVPGTSTVVPAIAPTPLMTHALAALKNIAIPHVQQSGRVLRGTSASVVDLDEYITNTPAIVDDPTSPAGYRIVDAHDCRVVPGFPRLPDETVEQYNGRVLHNLFSTPEGRVLLNTSYGSRLRETTASFKSTGFDVEPVGIDQTTGKRVALSDVPADAKIVAFNQNYAGKAPPSRSAYKFKFAGAAGLDIASGPDERTPGELLAALIAEQRKLVAAAADVPAQMLQGSHAVSMSSEDMEECMRQLQAARQENARRMGIWLRERLDKRRAMLERIKRNGGFTIAKEYPICTVALGAFETRRDALKHVRRYMAGEENIAIVPLAPGYTHNVLQVQS